MPHPFLQYGKRLSSRAEGVSPQSKDLRTKYLQCHIEGA